MSVPAPPPIDTGNQLLDEVPARLDCGLVTLPGGQRLALTVRTPSATVTVFLTAADAKTWAAQLTKAAGSMSAAGLVVA